MPKKPMGRPRLENPNIVTKGIRLDERTILVLNQIAKHDGVTFSSVIRNAIHEYIKKRDDVSNSGN